MLIHGLARTAHLDPLSTSLLTNLRALLHVEDPETDRLLAQVPNLKALRDLEVPGFGNTKTPWTNYGAEEITMTDFGTISGAETREQAEQVLSLYFPKHPSPEKLFATVRRALA
jgi:hypothetical protein